MVEIMNIFEMKDFSIYYGSLIAVKRVTLAIETNKITAIIGPSGCGKSTLNTILSGLDTPDQGRVLIDGEDLTQMDDRRLTLFRRGQIGIVFQFFNLLPILNLEENILLPHLLNGGSDRAGSPTDHLLREMGLYERRNHKPHELSGGELQRAAICRAMINDPEIILADEPTGNLDSASGRQVLEIFRRLKDEHGKTILLVTHSQEGAAIADRILKMKDGKLL
jgi:putative ABC transport system ATP-binding protein